MNVIGLPQFKEPPRSVDGLSVKTFSCPNSQFSTQVFLYADVLEEMIFGVRERDTYGMLVGTYSILPIEKRGNKPGDPLDFIEVTAFKDVYPCGGALEYAEYLRKRRNFRTPDGVNPVMGLLVAKKEGIRPTMEDLMLMRSYFADQMQIVLYVSDTGVIPKVYVLGDMYESFVEIGYSVVHEVGVALPFGEESIWQKS